MKLIAAIPVMISIVLTGCGEESKIKDAIKVSLKDPSSAQFKAVAVGKSGNVACAEFNAKNSLGGYGDYEVVLLSRSASDGWKVDGKRKSAELSNDICSKEYMDTWSEVKPINDAVKWISTVLTANYPIDDQDKKVYSTTVDKDLVKITDKYGSVVTIARDGDGNITVTPKGASLATEVVKFVARKDYVFGCVTNSKALKAICDNHNR